MRYICTLCRHQFEISDPARAAVTPCQDCGGRLLPLQTQLGIPISAVQPTGTHPSAAMVPGMPMPAQPQPRVEQVTFKKGEMFRQYLILGKLGQGGMGVVYKAKDRNLERLAALKILPPGFAEQNEEARKRFVREARSAAKLIHQNVVTIFEAGEESGQCYIAMEFIDGPSVQALIKKKGRLEPKLAVKVIKDAAAGLQFAHNVDLIHRDVKPDNILLHPSGMAKVADFGLAKSTTSDTANLTGTGHIVGTPHYMSPEQCEGHEIDRRADIYALSATLFHMLTGEPPYHAKSTMAILHKHVYDPVPDPRDTVPEIPERLAKAVMRGMAKDPKERFDSAQAMIDELDEVLSDERQDKKAGSEKPSAEAAAGSSTLAIQLAAQEMGAAGEELASGPQYWEEEEEEEEKGNFVFYGFLAAAILLIAGGAFVFRDEIRQWISPTTTTTSTVLTTSTTTTSIIPFEVLKSGARIINIGEPVVEVGHLGQTSLVAIRDVQDRVRLWDYQTQEPGLPLGSKAEAMALSPDGKKLAVAGAGEVHIYQTAPVKRLLAFQALDGRIVSMSFNPPSSELLAAGTNRRMRIFQAENGKPVKSPEETHDSNIVSAHFSAYRLRYVFAAHQDGQLRLWSAIDKELGFSAHFKPGDVTAAALGFNLEHTTVALLTQQQVHYLDPKSTEPQPHSLDIGAEEATCLAFSWRSEYLAVGMGSGSARIFRWPAASLCGQAQFHSDRVASLAFAQGCGPNESHLLISGAKDGRVAVISMADLLKVQQ
jgi:serine/threonine protein kinase